MLIENKRNGETFMSAIDENELILSSKYYVILTWL
jgi:hypothetical protein